MSSSAGSTRSPCSGPNLTSAGLQPRKSGVEAISSWPTIVKWTPMWCPLTRQPQASAPPGSPKTLHQ